MTGVHECQGFSAERKKSLRVREKSTPSLTKKKGSGWGGQEERDFTKETAGHRPRPALSAHGMGRARASDGKEVTRRGNIEIYV